MINDTSIIFFLDRQLEVFSIDFVKEELKLLETLEPEGKVLNLANKFEFLWQDLNERVQFKTFSQLYFMTGPEAGFTDSRMIFLWLKSWEMMSPKEETNEAKQAKILAIENNLKLQNLSFAVLVNLLEKAIHTSSLTYSRPPRLG